MRNINQISFRTPAASSNGCGKCCRDLTASTENTASSTTSNLIQVHGDLKRTECDRKMPVECTWCLPSGFPRVPSRPFSIFGFKDFKSSKLAGSPCFDFFSRVSSMRYIFQLLDFWRQRVTENLATYDGLNVHRQHAHAQRP